MAKKKKGTRNDSRGYGQANGGSGSGGRGITAGAVHNSNNNNNKVTSLSVSTSISSKTHDGMKALLYQMKEQGSSSAAAAAAAAATTTTTTTIAAAAASTTSQGTTATMIPSDRFSSRLLGIVDRLTLELGFQDKHIDQVVQALQYSITLETALDWLCLHLPTKELPPLFTDGQLRDAATAAESSSSSSCLTVLKFAKPRATSTSDSESYEYTNSNILTLPLSGNHDETPSSPAIKRLSNHPASSSVTVSDDNDNDNDNDDHQDGDDNHVLTMEEEKERAEHKARLLQQYQYVVDEDDEESADSKEDLDPATRTATSLSSTATTKTTRTKNLGKAPTTPSSSLPLSPDEEYLIEQERELKELEDDVNNDANNYMRTKHEIKELMIALKKKKQFVQGIRKRIDRANAKKRAQEKEEEEEEQQQQRATPSATGQDDNNQDDDKNEEEEGGGFFDLFGGGGDDDDNVAEEDQENSPVKDNPPAMQSEISSTPAPIPSNNIDAVIPSTWTGTTPQKVLEEHCKKQKLPRPKFTKLSHNQGYSLTLATTSSKKKKNAENTMTLTAYNYDFVKGSSLIDYLATKALYQMDSRSNLYRVFPRVFQDLWLSWFQQIQDAKAEQDQSRTMAKQQRLDQLLSIIQNSTSNGVARNPNVMVDGSIGKSSDEAEENADADPLARDHWDDDDEEEDTFADSSVPSSKSTSNQGEKLQELFERRKATSAYQEMLQARSNLPMSLYRQEILDTISKNSCTIISAQTGAGKTTQCPQFLLEQALADGRGDTTEILVTQPRRVAATSVAERVSEEMCEARVGGLVGYQIRMEAKRSAATKLLFCTTGIVLRRLQEDQSLLGITHVIVDEVHERQQQTDVLLIALRELLRTTRPDLKIILMSATLDSNLFCSFFGNAPLVSVPGRTFPVSSYHLEDLMDATDHMIEEGSRYALRDYQKSGEQTTLWVTNQGGSKRREVADLVSQTDVQEVSDFYPGYKMSTRRSMDRVNEEVINYDLLEDVLNLILCRPDLNSSLVAPDGADLSKGSVLIFLPGLGEIRSMTERLEGNRTFRDANKFEIIPMHSTLSSKDQRHAFLPARAGCRKIILSTNIAETSVTIPDVVCVIDTGRVREVRRNKRTSTSILVTDWCSKASSKQRAGRAGRVQPGICLKLYSSRTEQSVMKAASEPELMRVPLEEVCLSILASGLSKNSMDFLSKAPQPPSEDSVKAAVSVLEDVGAIEVNEYTLAASKRIERLTALGRHLAKLPVDVRLGKMLIFGALYRCLGKVLTIAASLSSQSPFSTFMADGSEAKAKQRSFCDPDSDFLTYCNVWEAFTDAASKSTSAGRKFCQMNYLNVTALREITDARRQFLDLLCSIGFVDRASFGVNGNSRPDPTNLRNSVYNENCNNPELLSAVICAGLYPNVACLAPNTNPGNYTMFHKRERLYFHNSSVNSRKKFYSESYVVFHEKFGTPSRVSVATTCFIHPLALLLLGGTVAVKHTQRLVVVDGWIEISMAAQIGVIMKELRKQIDVLLLRMIERAGPSETEAVVANTVDEIVNLLSTR